MTKKSIFYESFSIITRMNDRAITRANYFLTNFQLGRFLYEILFTADESCSRELRSFVWNIDEGCLSWRNSERNFSAYSSDFSREYVVE